jgi:hypothetical protein
MQITLKIMLVILAIAVYALHYKVISKVITISNPLPLTLL